MIDMKLHIASASQLELPAQGTYSGHRTLAKAISPIHDMPTQ